MHQSYHLSEVQDVEHHVCLSQLPLLFRQEHNEYQVSSLMALVDQINCLVVALLDLFP
jgi:hypothetical protein